MNREVSVDGQTVVYTFTDDEFKAALSILEQTSVAKVRTSSVLGYVQVIIRPDEPVR